MLVFQDSADERRRTGPAVGLPLVAGRWKEVRSERKDGGEDSHPEGLSERFLFAAPRDRHGTSRHPVRKPFSLVLSPEVGRFERACAWDHRRKTGCFRFSLKGDHERPERSVYRLRDERRPRRRLHGRFGL